MRFLRSYFIFLVITLFVCLFLTSASFSNEKSREQADTSNSALEVFFRTKAGDKIDGRQLGEVELQNLSTHEWKVEHVEYVDSFYDLNLKPGLYRLWVRRKQNRFITCGVARQSWKLKLEPGQMNTFTLKVKHWINNTGCILE